MLRRFYTTCTLTRRPISLELSLVRFFMVRARHPCINVSPSALTLFVRFILGIVVVLFFKCIAALFNPVYRGGERIKWGLVSYTAVAFSIVTVGTAVYLNTRSISYLNNREFPGVEGTLPPGPLAYQLFITPGAFGTVPLVSSTLNNWLADGLLVSSLSDACSLIYVSNAGSSSFIVVMSSTPRISGSSPSQASCTSAQWVRT